MRRHIGEIWRESWLAKKPWAVQGPGAIARYKTKKQATEVSNIFLEAMSHKLERERILNASDDTIRVVTGDGSGDSENPSS